MAIDCLQGFAVLRPLAHIDPGLFAHRIDAHIAVFFFNHGNQMGNVKYTAIRDHFDHIGIQDI